MERNVEVLIVGAGPTGLTLACELARFGVGVHIVDKAAVRSEQSRALAMQARTLEVLDATSGRDLAGRLIAAGRRVNEATFHIDGKPVDAKLWNADTPYPFALIIEQSETERVLEEELQAYSRGVDRRLELEGFTAGDDGVVARLRGADGAEQTVHARFLVGCDGAHSTVRHALNVPFEGEPYEGEFFLGDVDVSWDLQPDRIHAALSSSGVMAYFPFAGASGKCRLIGFLRGQAPKPWGTPLTLDELREIASRLLPVRAAIDNPRWLARFRVHHRLVSRWRVGNVLLAGDAAHIHSPVGGQGMNTGIQDAHNLAWKLARVCHHKASPDLLDSYEKERHPVARDVVMKTDRVTRLGLAPETGLGRFFRRQVAPVVLGSPLAQARASRILAQLNVDYKRSPIVSRGRDRCLRCGLRAPDAEIIEAVTSARTRLFRLFRSGKHTAIIFAGETPDPLSLSLLRAQVAHAQQTFPDELRVALILREPDRGAVAPGDEPPYFDVTGAAHSKYKARRAAVIVVRPDGYIGHSGTVPDNRLVEYFKGIVGTI